MKKFGKILSSVLAASMVVSAFAMNAFASKAHTVTVSADKTEGLVAGDTVTIELSMDNTEALASCDYVLAYDATAFVADTTKANRLEKYIDKAWMDGIKDTDGDWGYYLGSPTYAVSNGEIKFAWAGAEGVEADYAMDNRVIGKFYLQVAEGAANGEYTFSLTGNTGDVGDNSKAAMVTNTVTVKVGEVVEEVTTAPAYFNANFTAGGPKYNGNKGMEFFFKSAKLDKVASYIFNFTEMFEDVTFDAEMNVDVAIKVNDVPEDDTVTLTGYEWSESGR